MSERDDDIKRAKKLTTLIDANLIPLSKFDPFKYLDLHDIEELLCEFEHDNSLEARIYKEKLLFTKIRTM